MTEKEREEIILTDEERKFLYLCLKSKNIPSPRKKNIVKKMLAKFRHFLNVR